MKRICATVGFTFLAVLMLVHHAHLSLPWVFPAGVFFVCVLGFLSKYVRQFAVVPLILIAASLALIWQGNYADRTENRIKPIYDNVYTVNGLVTSSEVFEKHISYVIEIDDVGGFGSVKVFAASFDRDPVSAFSVINFTAKFEKVDKSSFADGIFAKCVIQKVHSVQNDGASFRRTMYDMRQGSKENLASVLDGDELGLSFAMFTGDRSQISGDLIGNMRAAGIAHIYSVSGLHLSIIAAGIYFFLRLIRINKKYAAVISILLLFVYAAFTGFNVGAVRAFIMAAVMLSAFVLGFEPESLNSLGLAALIILVMNPYSVLSVSFMLSFFATFGILLAVPIAAKLMKPLDKRKLTKYIAKPVLTVLVISLAAQLFTLPIAIYYFGYISTVGLVSNVLIFPFVTLNIYLTGISCLLWFLPNGWIIWGAGLCSKYIILIANWLSGYNFSTITIIGSAAFVISFIIIFFLLILYFMYKKNLLTVLTAVFCVIMLFVSAGASFFAAAHVNRNSFDITVMKTGANPIILLSHNGEMSVITSKPDDVFLVPEYYTRRCGIYKYEYQNEPDYSWMDTKYFGKWGEASLHIEISNMTILILDEKADAGNIPENLRNPDLLILKGKPENLILINPKQAINCSKQKIILKREIKVYTPTLKNDIIVKMYKGDYTIRTQ